MDLARLLDVLDYCLIIRRCPCVLLFGSVRVLYYYAVSACFIIRGCPRVLL